jgi:hypothetical protein
MTPADWAGLAVSIISVIAGFTAAIRWLVKHYLQELKPNGGSSIKDKVNHLEEKVDLLTDLVKEALRK